MDSGIFTIVIVLVSVVGGLLITAVSLFVVWKVFSGFRKSAQESAQLLATGQPAQARILAVRDMGASIQMGGQLPQQKLQIDLEVTPGGQPPYRASTTQLVSMMHIGRLQTGAVIEVRYDPMNPMRLALVL